MTYARRQQYRRLRRAIGSACGAGVAMLFAVVIASVGEFSLTLVPILFAVALGLQTRRWLHLAARSRVGAQSEGEVRCALKILTAEGWKLRHSLRWSGRGDIDSVAVAPGGFAFAIEVKTSRYDSRHLITVREQAVWLWRFRQRCCRHGVVPVLCVVRARGVHRWEDGVLVLSIDRLAPMLRGTANLFHSA